MAQVFETIMLLCFGVSWPFNIAKSLRSRTAKGKSMLFETCVIIGYICGITHKILYSQDIVMVLYIINFVMVAIDTGLYFYNKSQGR